MKKLDKNLNFKFNHLIYTKKFFNVMIIRNLGLKNWNVISRKMHEFTKKRTESTVDEIWLVEHPSIFTRGKKETFVSVKNINIPTVKSNRGGKITYHGPGQQMMYFLINLKRRHLKIHTLVHIMQETVINTLCHFHINANTDIRRPGVYIQGKKICSLGLRIERGCSLYGLALNVCMDLSPFLYIDPCGIPGLKMTQISYFKPKITIHEVQPVLVHSFLKLFFLYAQYKI